MEIPVWIQYVNALMPTVIALMVVGFVAVFIYTIAPRMHEVIEEKSNGHRFSAMRVASFVSLFVTLVLLARGVEIPVELWMFNAALWGLKVFQSRPGTKPTDVTPEWQAAFDKWQASYDEWRDYDWEWEEEGPGDG